MSERETRDCARQRLRSASAIRESRSMNEKCSWPLLLNIIGGSAESRESSHERGLFGLLAV
jgi:hypothetical protein